MRTAGALVGVFAIGIVAPLLTGPRPDPPAAIPANAIRVEVGNVPVGTRIAPGFVGLSTEYSSLTAYAGQDPRKLNPLFIGLVRNLAPGESPVIRIGGDTTDWTWWPLPAMTKPPWARFVLTARWIAVARAVARAARARLILGINFEADSRALAGAESRALLHGIGRSLIAAFELGNEPELYGQIGWYAGPRGAPVLGRSPGYGFRTYLADFRTISSALPSTVPLAGPALALTWPLTVASPFLSANPRVRLLTFHFYPLKRCFTAISSPSYPTLAHLLAPRSSAPPVGVTAAVSAARAHGVVARVDEVNSVSCRGLPGLSDTFASALWVVDALFRLARAGVDGVNIHTLPDVSYQPFAFSRSAGRWEAYVKPIYYGLLLFAQAAPAGSRLLPTAQPALDTLRTWASRGPGGTVRVVMVNESGRRSLTLAVRALSGAGMATLERLAAPGLTATSGVTLGGQSYGRVTTTATLSGRQEVFVIEPVRNRFVVELPPASAALLTVRGP